MRNRKEYGVPTAWLTHLAGNTVTLLLPEWLRLFEHIRLSPQIEPLRRVAERRVRCDPRYAGYVAPLALGFIASHPRFSIYHGSWAERNIGGFGADSLPHAAAAYALARLVSETALTGAEELPSEHPWSPAIAWGARHPDALAAACVAVVTLIWELSEYRAHIAELEATGRDPSEINMQWSLPDAITDTISNVLGLALAIGVRRRQ